MKWSGVEWRKEEDEEGTVWLVGESGTCRNTKGTDGDQDYSVRSEAEQGDGVVWATRMVWAVIEAIERLTGVTGAKCGGGLIRREC